MFSLSTLGIYDAAGRYLAPPPCLVLVRPDGPWETNTAVDVDVPLVVICAWCPGFDGTDPAHAGETHGICPSCAARFEQEAA